MGTAVWIEKAQFRMNAAAERAAVAQLKATFPTQAVFLDMGIGRDDVAWRAFASAMTFAESLRALVALGDHAVVQEVPGGGINGLGREGMMDELPARPIARFFAAVARFVEPGSYIEFENDKASVSTRFEFMHGKLRVVERELGADDMGDWGMIEHDRTEILLDPLP
ncbi:MAG: hypothetical protein R3F35_15210 [Myxococcota bacterium]